MPGTGTVTIELFGVARLRAGCAAVEVAANEAVRLADAR